jgi:predicted Zn-dependent protease
MKKNKIRIFPISIIFITLLFGLDLSGQDKLADILEEELNREMQTLSKEETPPYFMSYSVNDQSVFGANAMFGNLLNSSEDRARTLRVAVRIGDYKLDNTHKLDELGGGYAMPGGGYLPLDDEPLAIKQVLWNETNMAYIKAMDVYSDLIIKMESKNDDDKEVDDFSKEEPEVYIDPASGDFIGSLNKEGLEEKVRKYSAVFLKEKDIVFGIAGISVGIERKYFVSTEGTKIVENRYNANLVITGMIRSDDGLELPLNKTWFAYDLKDLPDDETVLKEVDAMIDKLIALRDAPIVEPYEGPAILSAGSAGVFFHEIFGHRVEGQRQKSESDGQTFTKKIGEKLLPKSFSIVFDPTASRYQGTDLNGYYKYDDEGVKAQKVDIVENGVLKDFLMSRCPIEGFPKSNGHGRGQAGMEPVARQSNLIVESSKMHSMDELRKMLIKECEKQDKEFGLLFKEVVGGFTLTGRYMPNAFNIMPTEVYRVFVDGRPDELVKGVDLIGTPLAMFSKIEAAGDKAAIFTGTCGAESGAVPVTAISPALFISQIEIQKRQKAESVPPILAMPVSQQLIHNLKNKGN